MLDEGEVGRDESMSSLSNNPLCLYMDWGEDGTDEGAKSDIWPDCIDHRLLGVIGAGTVTEVWDRIAPAES